MKRYQRKTNQPCWRTRLAMNQAYQAGLGNLKYLGDVTLRLRKMISDLRSKNSDLERRVWELEDHTPEECLEMASRSLEEFINPSSETQIPPDLLKSLRESMDGAQNESTVSGTSKQVGDE